MSIKEFPKHGVFSKPTCYEELKPHHEYFWWLTDVIKPEYSLPDQWVVVYIDRNTTQLKGTFIGPLKNDYFEKRDYEIE